MAVFHHLEELYHHHLLQSHHWLVVMYRGELKVEVSPTHPHEGGHREIVSARNLVNARSIKLFNYKRLIQYALNFGYF